MMKGKRLTLAGMKQIIHVVAKKKADAWYLLLSSSLAPGEESDFCVFGSDSWFPISATRDGVENFLMFLGTVVGENFEMVEDGADKIRFVRQSFKNALEVHRGIG